MLATNTMPLFYHQLLQLSFRLRIALVAALAIVVAAATFSYAAIGDSADSVVKYSLSSSRTNTRNLQNKTLSGDVYIVANVRDVKSVTFFLNPSPTSNLSVQKPFSVEYSAPFDFNHADPKGKAYPYNTANLKDGTHKVVVVVLRKSGRKTTHSADFIVKNQNSPVTTTTTQPVVTTTRPTTTAAPVTTVAPTTTKPPVTTTAPPSTSTGKPNASNTGYAHTGVTLKNSGSITVTTDGAVIDSLNVTGCITVRADNVTIKRSKINSSCYHGIEVRGYEGYTNLLIEDVEVDGRGSTDNCIAHGGYTARRVNLYGCSDGAKLSDNTTIEDSYIHNLGNSSTCHCDALQTMGGNGMKVLRNNLDVPGSNAGFMIGDEFGSLKNITIDGNYFNGGNFQLFGGNNSKTGTFPSPMTVINNKFGDSYTYGTHAYVHSSVAWANNTREKTGAIVNR